MATNCFLLAWRKPIGPRVGKHIDYPARELTPVRDGQAQIRQFRILLRGLRQTKTFLISTHILQEVETLADRILLVDQGRLIFDGAPEEMMENGSLEEPFYRLTARARANA